MKEKPTKLLSECEEIMKYNNKLREKLTKLSSEYEAKIYSDDNWNKAMAGSCDCDMSQIIQNRSISTGIQVIQKIIGEYWDLSILQRRADNIKKGIDIAINEVRKT